MHSYYKETLSKLEIEGQLPQLDKTHLRKTLQLTSYLTLRRSMLSFKTGRALSPLPFNIKLEVLASAVRQGNKKILRLKRKTKTAFIQR